MKKIIVILAAAATLGACKNSQEKTLGTETQAEQQKTVQPVVVKKEVRYVQAPQAQTQQKKGWSKAAKGTVIGAASGAVLGAVVAKNNRGTGAVIGGVAGGTAGYIIGRKQDKKDGRVQ
jgi:outer membrane lipoprotein SlyB